MGFHREWFEHQRRHRKTILLAPRGHGKSTICDVAYILWRLVNDQNLRILIASKTIRQAILFLAEVKQHMEINPNFRWLFGDWVYQDEWKENQIRIPRSKIMKEPTITAIGMGGSLPTWHFDLIIVDDIHDLNNARTPGQREQVWRWYEEVVLPTLEPDGEIHVIGTRWDADDLYGRLIAKSEEAREAGDEEGAYHVLVARAIKDEATREVLWEERWPYHKLMAIKREQGPIIFSLQYQCDASVALAEGPVFKSGHFRVADERKVGEAISKAAYVVQAWDLATGEKEIVGQVRGDTVMGDYTAGVTVVLTEDMEFYVVDWWRGRPGLEGQLRQIKAFAAKWEPHVIGIESVAYQAVLSKHLMRTSTLPIMPIRPDRDKVRRAWAVLPYVEQGRVWIAQSCLALRDLVVSFPLGEEDDSVDAFVYALGLAARRFKLKAGEPAKRRRIGM